MSDYKSPYQQHYDEGYIDGQELAQERIAALEKVAEAILNAKRLYPALIEIEIEKALRAAGYLGEDG